MSKEKISTQKQYDIRTRLQAMQGKPLPAATVHKGMRDLEQKLERQRETQQRKRATSQYLKQFLSPLYDPILKDPKARDAMYKHRAVVRENPRRPERGKFRPLPSQPGEPQVKGPFFTTVSVPPYNYDWSWSNGSGHKDPGNFGALVSTAEGAEAGAGGVGVFFSPMADRLIVRFSAFVRYSYEWKIDSSFLPSRSSGFIGLLIQSFDLSGGDNRQELDSRTPLWDDGTSGTNSDGASAEDQLLSPEVFFYARTSRQYVLWVWGGVSGYGDNDNGPISSYALADLVATVPFMVIEQ